MIRTIRKFFSALLLLFLIQNSSANIRIAVSIFPVYDILHQIAPDVETILVIPPGANPHTYEPLPSIIRSLQNIQMFIGIEKQFDGWIESIVDNKTKILYLSLVSDELPHAEKKIALSQVEQENFNPHIWLSITHAKTMVHKITDSLCKLDPINSQIYKENSRSYSSELEQLDKKFNALFSDVKTRKFIQWHAAWDYFAADYHLQIIGTIEHGHGDTPSVRGFQSLIRKAKDQKVRTIVIGLNVDNATAVSLSNEINGHLVRLDTMGNPDITERAGYVQMMNFNARVLYMALND